MMSFARRMRIPEPMRVAKNAYICNKRVPKMIMTNALQSLQNGDLQRCPNWLVQLSE